MGKALFEKASKRYTGNWSKWGQNAHDPSTHIDVALNLPPDARTDVWDGTAGTRAATAQELTDYDSDKLDERAVREIDDLKGLKALATETLLEINAVRTNAGMATVSGAAWRQRLIDRYKGL